MPRLGDLKPGASIKQGRLPNEIVTVVDVAWHRSNVVELTYKGASGRLGSELLLRDWEPTLEIVSPGRLWNFVSAVARFRLVSEAYRIRLAYLFEPVLAVYTCLIEPLPHQITAVYGEMLTRQPLRFLLADDPAQARPLWRGCSSAPECSSSSGRTNSIDVSICRLRS